MITHPTSPSIPPNVLLILGIILPIFGFGKLSSARRREGKILDVSGILPDSVEAYSLYL
jgi:hypothetical protein